MNVHEANAEQAAHGNLEPTYVVEDAMTEPTKGQNHLSFLRLLPYTFEAAWCLAQTSWTS